MKCPQCDFDPFSLPPIVCVTDRTPRLDALFASNEPPLDTDAPMLQQKLSQARAESANLDIRIAAVRAVVEGLLAQKAIVDGYAERIQAIYHPMRTLPADVLGEIFSSFVKNVMYMALSSFRCRSFIDSLDVRKGPCVLTHVSSGWRRTALHLPRLWTRIQLQFDRRHNRHASDSLLQIILSRSLNLPLHITLYASSYDISDCEELSVLLGTSNRWQSAALSLPYSIFVALNSRITLDALQTIWINLDLRHSDPAPPNQIQILERAPRLRSIAVHDISEFLNNFTVAWSQITHFTGMETTSLDSFCTLFSKAVNLSHASFPNKLYSDIDSGHNMQISMSNIAHLDVESPKVANILLKNIDFPRLQVLRFTDSRSEHYELPDALRPATGSAIRELSACPSFGNCESLVTFLSTVPYLSTLELCGTGYNSESGLCVYVLGNRPDLVPRLHTLRLRGPKGVQMTEQLVKLIKARRLQCCSAGEPMLRRIVLDRGAEAICPRAVNGLEELVGQGLEVQWSSAIIMVRY